MIGAYLIHPIFVLRHGAVDAYNQGTAPTREATLGFVEYGSRLVRNLEGHEVVSAARVLMEMDAALNHQDRIEHLGVAHPIIRIDRLTDFGDVGMYVYLG